MLLNDIIDLATDDKQSITTLLRKCLVLASQLKNERLKAWANQELNGYDSGKELPEYRILAAGAVGVFAGPGGMQIQRNIPSTLLEDEHKDWAKKVYLSQPVMTLEHSIESKKHSSLIFPWDDNLTLRYQDELLEGWGLLKAYQETPKSVIAGLLDTVRTRVLNMALEIKSEVGGTDADLEHIGPREAEKVDQTINNYIYGGNVYVAAGQSTMNATTIQQQQQNIVAGDWEHLAKVLRTAGVSGPELDDLSTAVKEDGKTMGERVKCWIEKTAPKVLSGGVKIGVSVGQTLLVEYLKQYYGLS